MDKMLEGQADSKEKFCIIGGGLTGIGLGKTFKQNQIAFDIIEKEKDFGGLWGIDYACGKVYSSTHLITPKNTTQFNDIPMPADYPDYPNHKLVLSYLQSVANHFDLYAHTTFNTSVTHLEEKDGYWLVTLSNGETRLYQGVIIAAGRSFQPLMPHYPGKFSGPILHSSQYKHPSLFKNKRVLIVGSGNSGCDIAVDAVYFAEKTIQSMRRGYHYIPKYIEGKPTQYWLMELAAQFPTNEAVWLYAKSVFKMAGFDGMDYGLPQPDHQIYEVIPILNSQILYHIGHGDLQPKPDITLLKKNSVVFNDGTEENIDLIIYASGYRASFPFLPAKYGIKQDEDMQKLFLYCFHRAHDNLLFAGYNEIMSSTGSVVNTLGNLFSHYIKALQNNTSAFQIFQKLKQGPNPDLGQYRYMKVKRNTLALDAWRLMKTLVSLTEKLQ